MGREADTEGLVLKTCTKCKEEKPLEEYYKSNKVKSGRKAQCKTCWKKQERKTTPYQADKVKTCKECNLSKPTSEFDRHSSAKYGVRSVCKVCRVSERKQNIDKFRPYLSEYNKRRRVEDPQYRMRLILRNTMNRWKLGSTQEMMGISFEEFASLYSTGEGMHLDHKIPMSWFDLNNPEHCRVCQHHSNLQWITPEENLKKGNRYADINGEKVLREDFNLDEYIKKLKLP